MAQYPPPTENVPIFDTNLFEDPNEYLTVNTANKKYLKYPNAQGAENLQDITVAGTSIFNQPSTFNAGFQTQGALSVVQFNNYVSKFLGDLYEYGEMQFLTYSDVMGLSIYNDGYNEKWNYFDTRRFTGRTDGEIGVLGKMILLGADSTQGIGLRAVDTDLGGIDDLSIYVTAQSAVIWSHIGNLDILGFAAPLGNGTNDKFRLCNNKVSGVLSTDVIYNLSFSAYDGVNTTPYESVFIRVIPASTWTPTSKPAYMQFWTTISTTATSKMTLTPAGFLRIGVSQSVSSAPLHISTVNASNPMVIVDGGSSATNLTSILLSNDYTINSITQKALQLALVRSASTLTINSQINDAVVRCINQIGTTTNWLRLSACYDVGKNAPSIDNNNIVRLGDESVNANATITTSTPLMIGSDTTTEPNIYLRGLPTATTIGGCINFKCPTTSTNQIIMRTINTNDFEVTTKVNGAICYLNGLNLGSLVNATYDCGTTTAYWKNVRGLNAYIAVSDVRKKIDIKPSTLGLDFINDLKPVSYKWKDYTDREHFGLIAQDVKESLDKKGCGEAGIWCLADKDDLDSQQALRYTELISPMIQAIKDLTLLVSELRTEINELKSKQ